MSSVDQTVNVPGSGNNVFMAGRDLHYEVQQLSPTSAEDRRNLLGLLELVRRMWIENVLESSVYPTALLELGKHAVPSMTDRPWARVLEAAGDHDEVLPPGTTIGQVFERVGRTLLILGEPGAGKTTALLTLARECADRAERDPFAPVPVVISLSTWAELHRSIGEWLVAELTMWYHTGRPLAEKWLGERRLLLLLDGLDEVAEEWRTECVRAVHAFVDARGISGLAICCRRDEYAAMPVKLKVGGAIELLPLTPEQIYAGLDAAGTKLLKLRAALRANEELLALAESPLMLNLMAIVFADAPAGGPELGETLTRQALRDRIFTHYVERMFVLRGHLVGPFSRRQTVTWLCWLARVMLRRGESIFAVELLQPAWVDKGRLLLYALVSRAAGALAISVGAALPMMLLSGLDDRLAADPPIVWLAALAGLTVGILSFPGEYSRLRMRRLHLEHRPWDQRLADTVALLLVYAFLAGLGYCFACIVIEAIFPGRYPGDGFERFGLLGGYFVTLFPFFLVVKRGSGQEIRLDGAHVWQWRSALKASMIGGLLGLALSPIVPSALLFGSLAGILFGWRYHIPPVEKRASASAARAIVNTMKVSAYVSLPLLFLLVYKLPLESYQHPWLPDASRAARTTLAVLGIPAFFWFGGLDIVLHASLRLVLWISGAAPLRLRRFLDYAVHLGFLRRAGGGYIFIHRLLLEHFAARAPTGPAATLP